MPLTQTYNRRLAESVWWNLLLLTVGAFLVALSAQGVAAQHGFLSGGIMGVALLAWYATHWASVSVWYFLLCLPVYAWGWFFVGKRFLLYTFYGTVCTSFFGLFLNVHLPVHDDFYAAVLAGVINGAGCGIMLRSLGSAGGTDVIAVALKQRWNLPIGQFSFGFNLCLFAASTATVSLDLLIASTINVFLSAHTLEYVLGMFNQRKMVLIISDRGEEICEAIILTERFGATLVRGKGGYRGSDREILLTVTNNVALKRLENLVYSVDEHALFIVQKTFYVSGGQFSRRLGN